MAFADGYLSDLIGRQAVLEGPARLPVGRVVDFYVGKPDDTFPRIDGIVVRTKAGPLQSSVNDVVDIDENGVLVLRVAPSETPAPEHSALFLVKDLFDKQIVDVDGRKVVRINDLEIANTSGTLRVVAADIGVAGLLRRLGAGRIAPRLLDRVPRNIIAWDNVAPISDVNPTQVQLSVSESRLSRLHPSELADIIGELSAKDAARVVGALDDETAADAFEHLDADVQQSIIADLGTDRAADIIEEMDSDDAADLLGELDEERKQRTSVAPAGDRRSPTTADDLRRTRRLRRAKAAGGLMTTDYFWIYPHRTTVAATIGEDPAELAPETEFVYYLYVTDDPAEKLLGTILSLRTLLLSAPDGDSSRCVMETDIVSTSSADARADRRRLDDRALRFACRARCSTMTASMLGIVTVDDAIDAIIPEQDLKKQLPRFTKRHRHGEEPRARCKTP